MPCLACVSTELQVVFFFFRKLYVSLTVAICLLITCLMMYFLFPRSIAVIPAGLNASSISFDNTTYSIILNMTVSVWEKEK